MTPLPPPHPIPPTPPPPPPTHTTTIQVLKGQLMSSEDVRERYYAGVYLLKHWMLNQQDKYWRTLRQLIAQAQHLNDNLLLDNPYQQISSMLNVDA